MKVRRESVKKERNERMRKGVVMGRCGYMMVMWVQMGCEGGRNATCLVLQVLSESA